jgi:hypothetical protein
VILAGLRLKRRTEVFPKKKKRVCPLRGKTLNALSQAPEEDRPCDAQGIDQV